MAILLFEVDLLTLLYNIAVNLSISCGFLALVFGGFFNKKRLLHKERGSLDTMQKNFCQI